jgi:hypothetical protein
MKFNVVKFFTASISRIYSLPFTHRDAFERYQNFLRNYEQQMTPARICEQ